MAAGVRAIHFLTLEDATPYLRPSMARRLTQALSRNTPAYADFGRSLDLNLG